MSRKKIPGKWLFNIYIYIMEIRLDTNMGYWAGILFMAILAKYFIVPWLSWWEILEITLRWQIVLLW